MSDLTEHIEKLKTQITMAEDCMNRANTQAAADSMAILAGAMHAVAIMAEYPADAPSFLPFFINANEDLLTNMITSGACS